MVLVDIQRKTTATQWSPKVYDLVDDLMEEIEDCEMMAQPTLSINCPVSGGKTASVA